ncbi:MAG: RNA polymerase sigma factor [Victivallales bacterium]|nr:RNA polymerase sigma factor [Victivallales bacterium]MBT7164777.1 RNA polymerase sigma factor [Victivallales bacterium]MBT7304388.1 RNA polymerase sigma factor [Victivallales bacterium]
MPAQTTTSDLLTGEAVLDRLSEATDKKLVKWMHEGDTTAFEELFRRYETRLISYAARYIGSIDLAKDVCQEVFLKLISKPPLVLICDSVGPWLFRVTRNLAIDKRRRRKFEIQGEDHELPEARAEGNPLSSLTAKDDRHMIREMVDELPKDIRDVVELRIDGRVPFKDIAVILDIPQGTALWRMHRAVQLLRQRWKTYEANV